MLISKFTLRGALTGDNCAMCVVAEILTLFLEPNSYIGTVIRTESGREIHEHSLACTESKADQWEFFFLTLWNRRYIIFYDKVFVRSAKECRDWTHRLEQ